MLASRGVACCRLWQEALDTPIDRGSLQRDIYYDNNGVLAAQRGEQGATGGHRLPWEMGGQVGGGRGMGKG